MYEANLVGIVVADVEPVVLPVVLLRADGLAKDGLLVVHEGDGAVEGGGRAGPVDLSVKVGLGIIESCYSRG